MSFDFEAFINGTKLPTIPVPLYRVDNSYAIAQTRAALAKLPKEPADERESDTGARADLEARLAELEAEQESSKQEFEIRALGATEYNGIASDKSKDVFDQIALQSQGTANEAPRETWERVAASVPAMQWDAFVDKANDIILSRVVVPDFSRSSSKSPKPPASSES